MPACRRHREAVSCFILYSAAASFFMAMASVKVMSAACPVFFSGISFGGGKRGHQVIMILFMHICPSPCRESRAYAGRPDNGGGPFSAVK